MEERNVVLFDGSNRNKLLPFTFTRPTCEMRVGIYTIKKKWEKWLGGKVSYKTQPYLAKKFPLYASEHNLLINGAICPSEQLVQELQKLAIGQSLWKNKTLIAAAINKDQTMHFSEEIITDQTTPIQSEAEFSYIKHTWDIFAKNDQEMRLDFPKKIEGRKSAAISDTNKVFGADFFVEEGAKIEGAILNSTTGPIYIGKEAEVMEGSLIRGPFALLEESTVKMGAKIYGATTIGPHCKVGGEINNVVVFGYTNKAHDGFLGNAVLGEWVNIGADTNNSNLKNNYANVKLWDYDKQHFVDTGLQFCGLFMGDHSKSAINTMFNTGTVVGVFANIFGAGFPRNFIPSYSWGGSGKVTRYKLSKAFEVAEKVMERRDMDFSEVDQEILSYLYDLSEENQNI